MKSKVILSLSCLFLLTGCSVDEIMDKLSDFSNLEYIISVVIVIGLVLSIIIKLFSKGSGDHEREFNKSIYSNEQINNMNKYNMQQTNNGNNNMNNVSNNTQNVNMNNLNNNSILTKNDNYGNSNFNDQFFANLNDSNKMLIEDNNSNRFVESVQNITMDTDKIEYGNDVSAYQNVDNLSNNNVIGNNLNESSNDLVVNNDNNVIETDSVIPLVPLVNSNDNVSVNNVGGYEGDIKSVPLINSNVEEKNVAFNDLVNNSSEYEEEVNVDGPVIRLNNQSIVVNKNENE